MSWKLTFSSSEADQPVFSSLTLGLSAALRFAQLNQQFEKSYSVTLLEKGSEIGNHILSGNCFEPTAINQLIPNWK